MEIQAISTFLEKFRTIARSREFIKKEIAAAIQKTTGIAINHNDITVRNNTILIQEKPSIKSVIFIHRQTILYELKGRLDKKAPTDIR